MYSLVRCLLILLINATSVTNLRCHEDRPGSIQIIENCRACVIYIDIQVRLAISPRTTNLSQTSSIEELAFVNERARRHRRNDRNIVIRQTCAREADGPLYGYDQTHCYCNSNRCNSDIQRCIYEIASKRYFSCYHGSNASHNSLEIHKKCRSCRIRIDTNRIYHYECLTFGEREQNNLAQCTCQYPMCNQDLGVCQRFQEKPSQPRVNAVREVLLDGTQNTTITTTVSQNPSTSASPNDTIIETKTETVTLSQITSASSNESKPIQTIVIEIRGHASYFSTHFSCILSISVCLLIVCDHYF